MGFQDRFGPLTQGCRSLDGLFLWRPLPSTSCPRGIPGLKCPLTQPGTAIPPNSGAPKYN